MPLSCLDVAKLLLRKPSPRFSMATPLEHSPWKLNGILCLLEEPTFVDSQKEIKGLDKLSQSWKLVAENVYKEVPTNQMLAIQHEIELK